MRDTDPMPFGPSNRDDPGILHLGRGERLTTVEHVAVLIFMCVVLAVDVLGVIVDPGPAPLGAIFSIAATITFACYLWWPPVATALLGGLFLLSVFFGHDSSVLFAAAMAAGMVMRLGSTVLILTYLGGFFIGIAFLAFGDDRVPVNIGIYLLVATVAGALGYALRLASDRRKRLEQRLAESGEQERQAVLAERRWIAGELHDSIAHHLTVVALHVQMLDDPAVRDESQAAIRVAARKAMADLRFVIELADDVRRTDGVRTGDLGEATTDAVAEISAAGHPVEVHGDPADERIPRVVDIVFARIVRESATNILKHAGPGVVTISVQAAPESIRLSIHSPLPLVPRSDLPSSGTGLNRMAQRVAGANGEFFAGPVASQWQVSARLPLAGTNLDESPS